MKLWKQKRAEIINNNYIQHESQQRVTSKLIWIMGNLEYVKN